MRAKAKVLIAEDSAHMRMILKDLLLRGGYEVTGEAGNGAEAVKLYEELRPDIVTLDITMPEMDGIETLKAIKAAHPKARIVMAGSMSQQDKIIEALRSGANDFFIKPMQAERVIESIENTLKQ